MKAKSFLSLGALLLVLVLGIGYLAWGVLGWNPARTYTAARLLVPNSAGIAINSPVLLSGVPVGQVTAMRKAASGVEMDFRVDDRYRIPMTSSIRIEALSALGEPYIEFEPASIGGPYVADGAVLDTRANTAPSSIPELAVRVVDLVDQLDPHAIRSLVATLDDTLADTGAVMPKLERSTKLLAAALLSRTASVRQLLADVQTMGSDLDWAGPSLAASGPEWGKLGDRVTTAVTTASTVFEKGNWPQDYVTGDGIVPFLDQLTALLDKVGPGMSELVPVLQPLVAEATRAGARLDISALISQAVGTVGDDGTLRLHLNVSAPGQ